MELVTSCVDGKEDSSGADGESGASGADGKNGVDGVKGRGMNKGVVASSGLLFLALFSTLGEEVVVVSFGTGISLPHKMRGRT